MKQVSGRPNSRQRLPFRLVEVVSGPIILLAAPADGDGKAHPMIETLCSREPMRTFGPSTLAMVSLVLYVEGDCRRARQPGSPAAAQLVADSQQRLRQRL